MDTKDFIQEVLKDMDPEQEVKIKDFQQMLEEAHKVDQYTRGMEAYYSKVVQHLEPVRMPTKMPMSFPKAVEDHLLDEYGRIAGTSC